MISHFVKVGVEYTQKQYESSRETGMTEQIIINGTIRAQILAILGRVRECEPILNELGEEFSEAGKNDSFLHASGLAKLNTGKYAEAIPFYEKAIKASIVKNNTTVYKYSLAEAHIRAGNIQAGEGLLQKALKEAETSGVPKFLPPIYSCFLLLSLKRGKLGEARAWEKKRLELKAKLGLPAEENDFLLLAEGDWDGTIRLAEPYLSTETEEKINKRREIAALIILAQAWHGKKEAEKAAHYLRRAEDLMQKTGCYREKDRFEETRQLLESK